MTPKVGPRQRDTREASRMQKESHGGANGNSRFMLPAWRGCAFLDGASFDPSMTERRSHGHKVSTNCTLLVITAGLEGVGLVGCRLTR